MVNATNQAIDSILASDRTFVVIDSISRAVSGSLVEDKTAIDIINRLNSLGISWLGLAHTPRNDDSHVYGSIHFEAGADLVVKLNSQKKENLLGVTFETVKENDIGKNTIQLIACEFEEEGLYGIGHAKNGELPGIENGGLSLLDRLVDHIRANGSSTAVEVSRNLQANRSSVSKLFNDQSRFINLGRSGKRGVLDGLNTS